MKNKIAWNTINTICIIATAAFFVACVVTLIMNVTCGF